MITVQVKAQTGAGENDMEWFDIPVENDMPSQIAGAIEQAEKQARDRGLGFILCNFRTIRTAEPTP